MSEVVSACEPIIRISRLKGMVLDGLTVDSDHNIECKFAPIQYHRVNPIETYNGDDGMGHFV